MGDSVGRVESTQEQRLEVAALARRFWQAGFNVIPCVTKSPEGLGEWSSLKERRQPIENLERRLAALKTPNGLLIVTGFAGLFVVDFDVPRLLDEFLDALGGRQFCSEHKLPLIRTRGGGHIWCKLPQDRMRGPMALAYGTGPADAGHKTGKAIETKGRGAVIVAPGSLPETRGPTRDGFWRQESGPALPEHWCDVPELPEPAFQQLLGMCLALDEVSKHENARAREMFERMGAPSPTHGAGQTSVIQAWNEKRPVLGELVRRGWHMVSGQGGRERLCHPGSTNLREANASIYTSPRGIVRVCCFSPLAPVVGMGSFCSFDLLLIYDHGGDVKAAVRAAAEELGLAYRDERPIGPRDVAEQAQTGAQDARAMADHARSNGQQDNPEMLAKAEKVADAFDKVASNAKKVAESEESWLLPKTRDEQLAELGRRLHLSVEDVIQSKRGGGMIELHVREADEPIRFATDDGLPMTWPSYLSTIGQAIDGWSPPARPKATGVDRVARLIVASKRTQVVDQDETVWTLEAVSEYVQDHALDQVGDEVASALRSRGEPYVEGEFAFVSARHFSGWVGKRGSGAPWRRGRGGQVVDCARALQSAGATSEPKGKQARRYWRISVDLLSLL